MKENKVTDLNQALKIIENSISLISERHLKGIIEDGGVESEVLKIFC
jgi:hypothetical protein